MTLNNSFDVTIVNGESLSDPINLKDQPACRVWIPATFDGSVLTFQGARPTGEFFDLYDATGAEISLSVTAGRSYLIPRDWTMGCGRIRLRAGTAASPSPQTGNTVIGVTFRPFA